MAEILDVVADLLPLKRVGPGAQQRRAARQQPPPAGGGAQREAWTFTEELLAQGTASEV